MIFRLFFLSFFLFFFFFFFEREREGRGEGGSRFFIGFYCLSDVIESLIDIVFAQL